MRFGWKKFLWLLTFLILHIYKLLILYYRTTNLILEIYGKSKLLIKSILTLFRRLHPIWIVFTLIKKGDMSSRIDEFHL